MSKDKISSQEMVEQIAAKLSVSKRVAEEFLKSLFAEIEETLLKGEPVKIKNLGTFKMQWNEPRKSVNVQTGEVFTIEGYNKVTFTPDTDLKEAVNEPYSHLDSVELEGQELPTFEIEKPVIQTPETLRNLTEQASEIRDILSEINALSTPKEKEQQPKVEIKEENKLDIPDYDIILIDEEEETASTIEVIEEPQQLIIENEPINEPVFITPEPEVIKIIEEPEPETKIEQEISLPEIKVEEEVEKEISEVPTKNKVRESTKAVEDSTNDIETENETVEPFILGPKKKRKGLRLIIGLFIVILIIGGGIYAAYFSSSCIRCWVQYDLLSEANRQKISDYTDSFKGWFTSDKKSQGNDSIKNESSNKITLPDTVTEPEQIQEQQTEVQSVVQTDSLQQLFDSRREYDEFLGEEEITEGTRLTNIAQHYYGKKEFWVYIYEANRDNIVHPDRITPGTIVKVPKVDPRLIDKKNPRCLQKAKELHDLYVGKK
jgi:nucleoid DNA-binding protein/flagellar basal body-associated protein FliL